MKKVWFLTVVKEQAINWAMEKNVDIISMSFSILDYSKALEQAIEKARNQGIVLLCSHHDLSDTVKDAWPARFWPDTWVVSACNGYGFTPREKETPKQPGHYKLQGLDVAAGVIPFVESSDRISGSSVATAIAAGLSSLILSCARLSLCDPQEDSHCVNRPRAGSGSCVGPEYCADKNRRIIVKRYLDEMRSERAKEENFVLLEKFGEIDAKVKILMQATASSASIACQGFARPTCLLDWYPVSWILKLLRPRTTSPGLSRK